MLHDARTAVGYILRALGQMRPAARPLLAILAAVLLGNLVEMMLGAYCVLQDPHGVQYLRTDLREFPSPPNGSGAKVRLALKDAVWSLVEPGYVFSQDGYDLRVRYQRRHPGGEPVWPSYDLHQRLDWALAAFVWALSLLGCIVIAREVARQATWPNLPRTAWRAIARLLLYRAAALAFVAASGVFVAGVLSGWEPPVPSADRPAAFIGGVFQLLAVLTCLAPIVIVLKGTGLGRALETSLRTLWRQRKITLWFALASVLLVAGAYLLTSLPAALVPAYRSHYPHAHGPTHFLVWIVDRLFSCGVFSVLVPSDKIPIV